MKKIYGILFLVFCGINCLGAAEDLPRDPDWVLRKYCDEYEMDNLKSKELVILQSSKFPDCLERLCSEIKNLDNLPTRELNIALKIGVNFPHVFKMTADLILRMPQLKIIYFFNLDPNYSMMIANGKGHFEFEDEKTFNDFMKHKYPNVEVVWEE